MTHEVSENSSCPEPGVAVLTADEIGAVVSGRYTDIFSLLGLHPAGETRGLVVRVFLPQAGSVELLEKRTGKLLGTMKKIHPDGFFELLLKRRRKPFAYLLKVHSWEGEQLIEDPYRFGSGLNEEDTYLFSEGTQERTYRWMGAHRRTLEGVDGVLFAVWAPAATRVSVVGEFNCWDGRVHVMRKHPANGIWELFIPDIAANSLYKYEILDQHGSLLPLKSDPYARSMQHPPETASRVLMEDPFTWDDEEWMASRASKDPYHTPISIYEVNLGSWRRVPEQDNRYLSYLELADQLIPYVLDLGFTHIQLMPISEYPFDGSWGYQPIGLYAPSIRFGTPSEFKEFVNRCHRAGIGVLFDWVPGHFPTDTHGLVQFDGTYLYEYMDTRKGFHPDWNTLIYNYGRCEVKSFLISNANYWLEEFHLDGLRVDAVASMLYLDYSREEGEWSPNQFGGREHLEAIEFIKAMNTSVYRNHPGILMIAEESTAWPGVSQPVESGGLGFGFKWNMGWMNDTLRYMSRDPIYRQYHQHELTFGILYAWTENFILPLSHDEVVHGKGALVNKMPGDDWQKFANLRAYYSLMWAHPGKKLLFMGCEFAQFSEWSHDQSLDWHLLESHRHRSMQSLVRDLNHLYRSLPSLHYSDCEASGFQWLQLDNTAHSIFVWCRSGGGGDSSGAIVVLVNMTPETHFGYRIGVPKKGSYREIFNSDAQEYGGSGQGNPQLLQSKDFPWDGRPDSLCITVPPLATLFLQRVESE